MTAHQMTIAVAAVSAIVVMGLGGLMTEIGPWYRALRKPRLQPPDWLFGPAWAVIIGAAAWAGVLAWEAAPDGETQRRIVLLFIVNGALHALWSPLFFRFHRPDWALGEVVFLWLSILALILGLAPLSTMAGVLLAPYIVWVTFAAWLNFSIVRLNGPFGRR